MNLWHDKSYIAPSGPEWVERGYAMYDVHSVRFQFVYTEEQKKANRRAHTAADEGQALVMAAEVRNSSMRIPSRRLSGAVSGISSSGAMVSAIRSTAVVCPDGITPTLH